MKSYTQFRNITWAAVIGFGLFGLPGMMTPAAAVMFPTSTAVSVSSFTVAVGQSETGTATVNGICSPVTCTIDLTGSVQFKLDGLDVGGGPVSLASGPGTGTATFTFTAPDFLGSHTLGAQYSSDANYAASFGSTNFTITAASVPGPVAGAGLPGLMQLVV